MLTRATTPVQLNPLTQRFFQDSDGIGGANMKAMPTIKLWCFDLGDTIMIEETEVKDETRTTTAADLFPGMKDAVIALKDMGYTLALVADTRPGTYVNVLEQHGMYDLFSSFAISEELGTEKPDSKMFEHVLNDLDVKPENAVMCGNNLTKDIAGANSLGMTTVWFHWNERYATIPANALERPDCTVHSAEEFLALVQRLHEGKASNE